MNEEEEEEENKNCAPFEAVAGTRYLYVDDFFGRPGGARGRERRGSSGVGWWLPSCESAGEKQRSLERLKSQRADPLL